MASSNAGGAVKLSVSFTVDGGSRRPRVDALGEVSFRVYDYKLADHKRPPVLHRAVRASNPLQGIRVEGRSAEAVSQLHLINDLDGYTGRVVVLSTTRYARFLDENIS